MKLNYFVILLTFLASSCHVAGYCKIRCAYLTPNTRQDSLCTSVLNTLKTKNKVAHYRFGDSSGMSYVYLTGRDTKRVKNALSTYDSSAVVTKDLIQTFAPSAKRKKTHVVGLVLQDIASLKSEATVRDVFVTLEKK